jgi:hypothetical protein
MRKVRGEPIAWTKSWTKNSTSNCCNLEGPAHELAPRGQPKCQPKWLWRRQKTESWGREGGIGKICHSKAVLCKKFSAKG